MVIGGPPCTDFANFNVNINFPRMNQTEVRRRRAKAKTLLNFAAEIYELQRAAGRHFLHEHPETADSWKEPCIRRLMARAGVDTVVGHQCQMCLTTKDKNGKGGFQGTCHYCGVYGHRITECPPKNADMKGKGKGQDPMSDQGWNSQNPIQGQR